MVKVRGYLIAPACCWDSPQSCAMSASKRIYQTLSLWFFQLGAHVEGLGMRLGMRVLWEPSWPLTKQQSQLQMWLHHNIWQRVPLDFSPQVASWWYRTSSPCLRVGGTVKKMWGGWWETAQSSGLPSGSMLRRDSCRSEPTRATPCRFGSCYLATTILRPPCRYEAASRPPCSVVL